MAVIGGQAMKIVALLGSPRVNGNTSYLTDQALAEAGRLGIETEKIVLAQYQIHPCQGHDGCEDFASCPQEDDTEIVVQKLFEADGVILATPVYFQDVTSQLKTFIDRTHFHWYHDRKMRATCAGTIVVATRSGIEDTTKALAYFITRRSSIGAEQILKVHGFARREGQIRDNVPVVEEASRLGITMAEALLAR